MYKLTQNGETMLYAEKLYFIYKNKDGNFIPTDEHNAQGIVVNGVPYTLAGHDLIDGTEGIIDLVEFDGAEILNNTMSGK